MIKTHCNNLNENNLEHFNPVYLSEKLQDVKENEKLSDICINFNWELDNIYTLVNKNDQKLIQTTEKLLRKYIGLLWSLNDNIKEYEYVTSDGQTKFLHYIKQNQLLFKQIDQNLKHLKSLLKNNFLYI